MSTTCLVGLEVAGVVLSVVEGVKLRLRLSGAGAGAGAGAGGWCSWAFSIRL
jgi:hypothetical protein